MKLPRENKIPNSPRFDFVTRTAYELLLEHGYNRFPINPFNVLENLSDHVKCLAWSDAKFFFGKPDPFHLRETGSEARTIRARKNGNYYIVYDDMLPNSDARIAWTIMHEIGHVALGHLTDYEETALDRGGLTKKSYGVLEVEANYFAAEFLMPTALLKYFQNITIEEISLLFGVSEEAAKRKYKRVFNSIYLPYSDYEEKLIRNFFEFLDLHIDGTLYENIYLPYGFANKTKYIPICRKCPNCYTYIRDSSAIYCTNCGSLLDQTFPDANKQWDFAYIPGYSHPRIPYKSTKLSTGETAQKVIYCPNCLNSDFSPEANFCLICGQPLFNFCKICKEPLPLKSCFCPKCGAKSPFFDAYKKAEARITQIRDCSNLQVFSADWIRYPYWDYVRYRFLIKNDKYPMDLKSAMMYTNAYIDDFNNVIVFTDTVQAAATIYKNREYILDFMRKRDENNYKNLEAYVSDVL